MRKLMRLLNNISDDINDSKGMLFEFQVEEFAITDNIDLNAELTKVGRMLIDADKLLTKAIEELKNYEQQTTDV